MTDWLLPLLAGTATGVLSGFGVGGGTLLLIYLTAFAGLPQEQAQGINLLYFLPAAAASLPAHAKNGFPPLLRGLPHPGGPAGTVPQGGIGLTLWPA